jgi:hypothetical protein
MFMEDIEATPRYARSPTSYIPFLWWLFFVTKARNTILQLDHLFFLCWIEIYALCCSHKVVSWHGTYIIRIADSICCCLVYSNASSIKSCPHPLFVVLQFLVKYCSKLQTNYYTTFVPK